MELGSKVNALEEEIAILKGEIKTILQEVRTAVLARENPFAADAHENLHIPAIPAIPTPAEAAPEPETPPHVIKLPQIPDPQPDPEPAAARLDTFAERDASGTTRLLPAPVGPSRRWSLGSLATLIVWTQETAAEMDASDLDIVLSLARYGGLIDEEMEATLTKLAAPLMAQNTTPREPGVTDYLVALRELTMLIEEAEKSSRDSGPMRRAS
jgi:hypothetical protein